jgi:comEA protein
LKKIAFAILIFSSILASAIYFTKIHKFQDYVIDPKSSEIKVYNININLADWYEFSNLPGIGEKLGKQIIEDRESNGRFNSVEEILRVKGIGAKKFAAIKPYLTMEVTI